MGNRSTLHQQHVGLHVGAFHRINSYLKEIKEGRVPGPSFMVTNCSYEGVREVNQSAVSAYAAVATQRASTTAAGSNIGAHTVSTGVGGGGGEGALVTAFANIRGVGLGQGLTMLTVGSGGGTTGKAAGLAVGERGVGKGRGSRREGGGGGSRVKPEQAGSPPTKTDSAGSLR